MRVTTLVITILVIALLGTVGFGAYYLTKVDPIEQIKNIIPVTAQNKQPVFKFTVYGDVKTKNLFKYPMDVTVDSGTIYVADNDLGQVLSFDFNGKFLNAFGKDKLTTPYGIQVYGGQIYVADTAAGKIAIFDKDGTFKNYFKVKGKDIIGPVGDILIANDKIYASVIKSMKIMVFDMSGNLLQEMGSEGTGPGQLKYPHGLALDSSNNLYVGDSGNNRIVVFDSNGKYLRTIGAAENAVGELTTVRGLAFDNADNLYAVCGLKSAAVVFNTEGKEIFQLGKQGAGDGELALPNGIFIDTTGRIYITETGNKRISVFSP